MDLRFEAVRWSVSEVGGGLEKGLVPGVPLGNHGGATVAVVQVPSGVAQFGCVPVGAVRASRVELLKRVVAVHGSAGLGDRMIRQWGQRAESVA